MAHYNIVLLTYLLTIEIKPLLLQLALAYSVGECSAAVCVIRLAQLLGFAEECGMPIPAASQVNSRLAVLAHHLTVWECPNGGASVPLNYAAIRNLSPLSPAKSLLADQSRWRNGHLLPGQSPRTDFPPGSDLRGGGKLGSCPGASTTKGPLQKNIDTGLLSYYYNCSAYKL